MTLADRIDPTLAARARLAADRAAERSARDAFIVAQFALLGTRFDSLLRSALGRHSAVTLAVLPLTLLVQGRSFATLAVDTWRVTTSLNGTPQSVRFTPVLDFRAPDQFGLIECSLDFPVEPGRTRAARVAQRLTGSGVQLRGKTVASLLLEQRGDGLAELRADDLEDAFAAWWLR